ncbi:hypothetical protein MTO96_040362 [Rhipicephalus appendiculatus]
MQRQRCISPHRIPWPLVPQNIIPKKVSAYETAPVYTVKRIIKDIPLEEDGKSIHTNIVHARSPLTLAAKRLSNTTTVIVAFEGPRVPTYIRTKCITVVTPLTQAHTTRAPPVARCAGGTYVTADRNYRGRYRTCYVLTKRHRERRRAAQEAQAAAITTPPEAPLKIQDPKSKPLPIWESHTRTP